MKHLRSAAPEPLPSDLATNTETAQVAKVAKVAQVANVDGWTINLPTLDTAIASIIAAARRGESFSCLTLNLDHLVKLRVDAAFRRAYGAARFVTADGAPIAALARRQWPNVQRTTGADMILPLCDAASRNGLSVYLFGTSDAVLEGAAAELRKRSAGHLTIAGMESPKQGFDVESAEADVAIERIRQSGARICFVLLGAPKQEIFAARAAEAGVQCGFICVGAAADFIVGHQVRAPEIFRKFALEWLWRLGRNPRRLGWRYLQCALVLARVLGGEAARVGSRYAFKP